MSAPAPARGAAPLVAVVGATGTGKSGLALDLADALALRGERVEVVNADAMQLYRGMDIGTAKLPASERRGVPHHLLDVLDPAEEASVARYQAEARAAIDDIAARGAVPVLVGGSGLYVSSVLFDFRFPGTDPAIRERLETEAVTIGPAGLHARLASLDPAAAAAIGPHNARRLVRALEVVELTGEPFGAGLPDDDALWWPRTRILTMTTPRERLVGRLDARAAAMFADGLVAEVEALGIDAMGVTASRAIGYAQAIAVARGTSGTDAAVAETAALTRRYARRQVGWFKRYPAATPLDADDPGHLSAAIATIER
ncbi:tRNA (adenosine(37)-N6)-dimethylallyltransferase MiaA [Galbitalea sp. SE-J8]|uniref:tRNA (adenosine(37)-N6)-dimethylallyltransferase MiaA n=1 Tax=Galbitalea sp. SE-J8 TaxID=3054952 RepID=UPI00259D2C76|nr:tRNA (adenosine(37)-N6)-dimethylallyltransferase MiaA [Galbitalea sp. SE-J8]MDM4762551.1 tRNA (adenosine(37)-N6)-dimethylallyltransferase MiaA [Galbitalea sp. SE-J8]